MLYSPICQYLLHKRLYNSRHLDRLAVCSRSTLNNHVLGTISCTSTTCIIFLVEQEKRLYIMDTCIILWLYKNHTVSAELFRLYARAHRLWQQFVTFALQADKPFKDWKQKKVGFSRRSFSRSLSHPKAIPMKMLNTSKMENLVWSNNVCLKA
jgi:hypothetical protein